MHFFGMFDWIEKLHACISQNLPKVPFMHIFKLVFHFRIFKHFFQQQLDTNKQQQPAQKSNPPTCTSALQQQQQQKPTSAQRRAQFQASRAVCKDTIGNF